MGAYVTPPGDINAVYTCKRHARGGQRLDHHPEQ